jgi:hypothetical protein
MLPRLLLSRHLTALELLLQTSLKELKIKTCKLSRSVPEQLINVTTLNSLDLSENSLEGTFIADIEELFPYNNNLMGNFVCPTRIEKCLVSCENYLNTCRAL